MQYGLSIISIIVKKKKNTVRKFHEKFKNIPPYTTIIVKIPISFIQ